MKREKKLIGKRFSLCETERITVDGLDFWVEQIDWNGVFNKRTLNEYLEKSISILNADGVPVDSLIEQSPCGSMLRDYVINSKGMPQDSLCSLAAMVVEHVLHIKAYMAMPGAMGGVASLAYRLGRLTTLLDVYEIENRIQSKKAKNKRSTKADNEETVGQIVERLALAADCIDESAKQLWPRFVSELDRLGLSPTLDETDNDPKKWRVEYLFKDGSKPMTLGTFKNTVSRLRRKKSR